MEAGRYADTCRLVDQLCPHGRKPHEQLSDALIVKVYFFSTHCDRAVRWACEAKNWPGALLIQIAGGNLPSQSSMSRRMRTVGVLQLIERVQTRVSDLLLAHQPNSMAMKVMDSKPLRVSSFSKDRDARNGRGAGDKSRGYKVHAITVGKAFMHWTLTAMNTNDQVAAATLLPMLQRRSTLPQSVLPQSDQSCSGWGYVSADNGYDSNLVHGLAQAVNHQLLAPPRRSNAGVRDVQRNTKERIRSLDLFADPLRHCGIPSGFTALAIRERVQIERNFGNAAMHGLNAPPPWVRTPHRIAAWTAAKLIQTMVRQLQIIGVTM